MTPMNAMDVCLVTPAPTKSRQGNRITASRWARLLRKLGRRVVIKQEYCGEPCDLLIALHARKSHRSVDRFRRLFPQRPLIVALTGTDLYQDIRHFAAARRSLDHASRLVVLQAHGIEELPANRRAKARVIYQSVEPLPSLPAPLTSVFEICVMGHLRPVKDPFRTAAAVRRLPASSRIRVTHIGASLSDAMRRNAEKIQAGNRRYRWLGELPRWKAMRLLARSRVLVLTSKMEGGANVVCEALAVGVPVLSTRIGGTLGILGVDYPGLFPVGDTQALADLLMRVESNPNFLADLRRRCAEKAELVEPARELECWRSLLQELKSA